MGPYFKVQSNNNLFLSLSRSHMINLIGWICYRYSDTHILFARKCSWHAEVQTKTGPIVQVTFQNAFISLIKVCMLIPLWWNSVSKCRILITWHQKDYKPQPEAMKTYLTSAYMCHGSQCVQTTVYRVTMEIRINAQSMFSIALYTV